MPPTLNDLEYMFTDTGVLLNKSTNVLPFIDIQQVSGLDSAPFRTSEKDTEGLDGGIVEADFETIRTIIIDATLYATSTTIFDILDSLKANFSPSSISRPFYFKKPAQAQRYIQCKSLGVKYDESEALRLSTTPIQIQLKAADPTIYSTTPNALNTGLPPAAQLGRGYPRLYPMSYGGISTSGIITLTNAGNKPTGAVFSITGPVNNPKILSDTAGGAYLQALIALASTDVLTIDLGKRTVVLNGTANRRSTLSGLSDWFLIQPGDNSLRFSATTQTGSQLTAIWSHAWR